MTEERMFCSKTSTERIYKNCESFPPCYNLDYKIVIYVLHCKFSLAINLVNSSYFIHLFPNTSKLSNSFKPLLLSFICYKHSLFTLIAHYTHLHIYTWIHTQTSVYCIQNIHTHTHIYIHIHTQPCNKRTLVGGITLGSKSLGNIVNHSFCIK